MKDEPSEKFAVIGIGCRMPPNSTSLTNFWRFLSRGGNALRPIKKDRWDWRQFFDEDPKRPGKSYAPKAAFLDADIQQFDPLVFGISPREANYMDPQQRLLLEVAWEAFEDAGIPIEKISGTAAGVFIGAFCLDHLVEQLRPSNRYLVDSFSTVGASMTILSNRLSHVFNLTGPSLTLDTACSSSLVAIHYACQSLRLGEADMALAGGVNVMTCPDYPIMMSKGHFLSDHGECHAFDETAAGYARGEGAGIFLIKRLRDAVEAGDRIHAIIRGSGVNQDGHTGGISLPNSEAQEALLRDVYARAGVAPAAVDYVEAHGTGTQAGDPAESRALHRHFAHGRDPASKLLIGSVKTNVGHLEAAAGVAGMLKAIGVLQFREIPRNLHFNRPNPKIPFADYCLKVVEQTTPLPSEAEKPEVFVGINSFGYGGTNAHVILESARTHRTEKTVADDETVRLIPISARSEGALRDLAGKFAFQMGQGLPGSYSDLAYTTAFRRSHLEHRCAAIASNSSELREHLMAVSTGQPHEGVAVGTKSGATASGLVFVYTGMGPQWWAMGQELIRRERIVAETIEEIDAHFKKLAGWSLKGAMMAEEFATRMDRTEVAQPANFALQVALTRLWESLGIHPAAVVGHSVGEVASSYVAGIYSLDDAVRVSYHRSRLQQAVAGSGAMLAIGLPEAEATELIRDLSGVSIAAINSLNAVSLSGDTDQLEQVAALLERAGTFHRFLRVDVAYHSPQMDPLRDELLASLSDLSPKAGQIPLYSTAFGKLVPFDQWIPEYWWQNVRQPVRFADAIKALFADGFSSFLEIGPHPVLSSSIKEVAAHLERNVACFASLRRKEPEWRQVLLTLGELYCAGHTPNWNALAPQRGRFIPGPQYPWQRQRHWTESERSKMDRLGLPGPVYLNRSIVGPNPCWEVEINRNYFPFLLDHGLQNQTVFPGMAYVEAAIVLNRQMHDTEAVVLENVTFEKVLVVDYAQLQYLVTEFDEEDGRFTISSRVEGEEARAHRHCRGRMFPQSDPRPCTLDLDTLKLECPERVSIDAFYERLRQRGLCYGPAFRSIMEISVGADCFYARLDGSASAAEPSHPLHPTIADAAVQPVLYCAKGDGLFVPFSFEQFEYYSRPDSPALYAIGRLISDSSTLIVAEIWLTDEAGVVCAHAHRALCQLVHTGMEHTPLRLYYQYQWKLAACEQVERSDGSNTLVLADIDDSDIELANDLASRLPGSAILPWEAVPKQGFQKEALVRILTSDATNATRNHFAILWGSGRARQSMTVASLCALNEKVVGLLQAIGEIHPDEFDVTFVTRGAKSVESGEEITNLAASSISAVGLVAENEFEHGVCRSIDLPASGEIDVSRLVSDIAAHSRGDIAYRGSGRYEMVLVPGPDRQTSQQRVVKSVQEPVELRLGSRGNLESLGFEAAERIAPQEGEIELRVQTVSLNYKDLLKIDGRLHPIALEGTFNGYDLGMECAGTVLRCGSNSSFKTGDRVVSMLRGAIRSYGIAREVFTVQIPENLGMKAAAIPMAYLAAYRGLIDIANLEPGERLLIHHATGGVGLAAITIARWRKAEIFATAGSEPRRRFLEELGIKHVFSSRDLDFGQRIREVTNQEGVDVVIGAQTGQALHASLSVLRTGGRYIEVGKKDIAEDRSLPLRAFNRNLLFASVDIDRLMNERPSLIQQTLQKIFKLFENGQFELGPVRSFAARDIQDAFREMAGSRHIGKLLIDLSRGEVEVPETSPGQSIIKRDGSYIVTGGTSGFGLMTGYWLAEQGAGKVILVSRSGRKAPGIEAAIRSIEARGAKVEVRSVDVTDPLQVRSLVRSAGSDPFALRGILHAAMVLDDAMLAELTEERFRRVFMPKVAGALNLADAVADLPPIDFLAFYSSVSAIVGNPGQANYVAGNSILDGLAHVLRARGLPAISINWGALAESGVVARDERLSAMLSAAGITSLDNQMAFEALEAAIRLSKPQLCAFIVDWAKWHEAHPKLAGDPRFRDLRIRSSQGPEGSDAAAEIRNALAAFSKEQRLRALEEHLQEVLGKTLKMPKERVSVNQKLNEMGVDSLMVLELSLGIRERIGVSFSAMEFLKEPSVQQLASMAESRLWSSS